MTRRGTKSTTWAYALTENQTGNLSLCRATPNQLSHTNQGNLWLFQKKKKYFLEKAQALKSRVLGLLPRLTIVCPWAGLLLCSNILILFSFKSPPEDIFWLLQREEGREKKMSMQEWRERGINWLPPVCAQTGDCHPERDYLCWDQETCNLRMCPDLELKLPTFSYVMTLPATEPHWPGHQCPHFKVGTV